MAPAYRNESRKQVERRQRRGASGAPIVEKHTERGQGALLGLIRASKEAPEFFWPYQLVAVTNDQYSSVSIK
jgi:hypothetical protein